MTSTCTAAVIPSASIEIDQEVVPSASIEIDQEVVPSASIEIDQEVIPSASIEIEQEVIPSASIKIDQEVIPTASIEIEREVIPSASIEIDQEVIPSASIKIDQEVIPTASIEIEREVIPNASIEIDQEVVPSASIEIDQEVMQSASIEIDQEVGPSASIEIDQEVIPTASIEIEREVIPNASIEIDQEVVPSASIEIDQEVGPSASIEIDQEVIPTASIEIEREVIPNARIEIDQEVIPNASIKIEREVIPSASIEIDQEVMPIASIEIEQEIIPSASIEIEREIIPNASIKIEQEVIPSASNKTERDDGIEIAESSDTKQVGEMTDFSSTDEPMAVDPDLTVEAELKKKDLNCENDSKSELEATPNHSDAETESFSFSSNDDATDINSDKDDVDALIISAICESLISKTEIEVGKSSGANNTSASPIEISVDASNVSVDMEFSENKSQTGQSQAASPVAPEAEASNKPGQSSNPDSSCPKDELSKLVATLSSSWAQCQAGPSRLVNRNQSQPVAVKRVREVQPGSRDIPELEIGKVFPAKGGRKVGLPNTSTEQDQDRSEVEPKTVTSTSSCINEQCTSKATEFVRAPPHAVVYFGYVPIQGKHRYKICKACLEGPARQFFQTSKSALENQVSLLSIPISSSSGPCGTQFVDNSDTESEIEDIEMDDDIPEDIGIDQILENLIKDLHVTNQADAGVEYLEKETDDLEESFNAAENLFDKTSAEVEIISRQLQSILGPEYNAVVLKSVEIDDNGKCTTINNAESDKEVQDIAVARNRNAQKQKADFLDLLSSKERETAAMMNGKRKRQDVDGVDEINVVANVTTHLTPMRRLAPTPPVFPRIMPKVGDTVYLMKGNLLGTWVRGQVLEAIRNTPAAPLEYKVRFEVTPIKRGRSYPQESFYQTKNLSPKQIAYNLPCPFVLPVGTRVIALYNDEFKNFCIGSNSEFYVGIVAEPPKNTNDNRYLIFFDDGCAQYVRHQDVLLVCESSSSNNVWHDVHPRTKDFVKNYVQKFPERPMVKFHKENKGKQETVIVEWNGKWWNTRVVDVDCSLVKVLFEEKRRYEWIYRGSTRLQPMFMKASEGQIAQIQSHNIQPARPLNQHLFNARINSLIQANERKLMAVKVNQTARKSTSAPRTQFPPVKQYVVAVKKPGPRRAMTQNELRAFEGTMSKISLGNVKGPVTYVPHVCKPSCVRPFVFPLTEEESYLVNNTNPLSLPLRLGWDREVGKIPKRTVFYRAPCGRRLRTYEEVHVFLNQTKLNLGIDNFCYDYAVDCLNEFVASHQKFLLRDVSYGKESVPIQCVNSVDHAFLEMPNYTKDRQAGKGVQINFDEEFLTCCDCTDDCSDKDKCSCWQLTIEGTNLGKDTLNRQAGYKNRRLLDHVVSGIYECNYRCKCRATCFNRLVQNNLKWQLQIFKTVNKGWGVRSLHDIPQGAFICVYAGQLLTEQGANELGKAFGDEYLAELDYIEVMESIKDGYEAEVVESDEEERPKEDGRSRGRAKDPDYEELEEDSGEEDDHSRDTDFVIPGIKPSGSGVRVPNAEHRTPVKSTHYDENFDTSFARKSARVRRSTSLERKSESKAESESDEEESNKQSTRALFGPGEQCYIMDAKSTGNVGRYLNHCCTPNVFVQNVFVDTHDLRFPWVAFFAFKHIRAGTELTWDYNYEIGSVPGKTMTCHCNSPQCRGQLL